MTLTSDQSLIRIAELRSVVAAGGKLSLENMREVCSLLRGDRARAALTSSKSKAAKAKPAVNADDLLAGLDDL